MKKILLVSSLLVAPLFLTACSDTQAQEKTSPKAKVEKSNVEKDKPEVPALSNIVTTDLGGGIYMLVGQGGNIGVSAGEDGFVVIDDQFAPMAPKIRAALTEISDQDVRFLINTHYHGDHTGGNVPMHEHGADIIAHDNVYKRLSTPTENKLWGRTVQPVDKAAWPVITYSQSSTFYINGGTITLTHAPHGHTDGDSLVFFDPANVLHMGDNFFNGMLPYIDVDGGGSINGMIAAQEKGLSMVNENTKIIPGHGPLATVEDLKKTHAILVDMRDMIQARIEAGEDLETVLKTNPLEKYAEYGSFITPELMAKIIFRSLANN